MRPIRSVSRPASREFREVRQVGKLPEDGADGFARIGPGHDPSTRAGPRLPGMALLHLRRGIRVRSFPRMESSRPCGFPVCLRLWRCGSAPLAGVRSAQAGPRSRGTVAAGRPGPEHGVEGRRGHCPVGCGSGWTRPRHRGYGAGGRVGASRAAAPTLPAAGLAPVRGPVPSAIGLRVRRAAPLPPGFHAHYRGDDGCCRRCGRPRRVEEQSPRGSEDGHSAEAVDRGPGQGSPRTSRSGSGRSACASAPEARFRPRSVILDGEEGEGDRGKGRPTVVV